MALNKVEICGVNTSRLPILTNDEKEVLFERIKQGDMEARESERTIYQRESPSGAECDQTLFQQQ